MSSLLALHCRRPSLMGGIGHGGVWWDCPYDALALGDICMSMRPINHCYMLWLFETSWKAVAGIQLCKLMNRHDHSNNQIPVRRRCRRLGCADAVLSCYPNTPWSSDSLRITERRVSSEGNQDEAFNDLGMARGCVQLRNMDT